MDKLKMHSPDMTQQNIEKIKDLFPNCVTESKGANGELKLAIDFDQLKQELSNSIVEGPQERYQLNWPGKREALLTANAPIAKTLRPCREESVNFDTTENLFIEGDNLDALKMLQETYLGKVKMIYIDPPYNTGKDFIYSDNFAENSDAFLKRSNQNDEDGNRLVSNTESNGRFHSDWLSMMYSRLKSARNLLKDDGVIFISIDDTEQSNIKKICDEIFGEINCVGEAIIVRSEGGGLAKQLIKGHDNLHIYAKNINCFESLKRPKDVRGSIVKLNNEEYWIEEDWLRKEFGKYGTCPYAEIENYHGKQKKDEIDEGLAKGIYTIVNKNGVEIVGRYRKLSEDGSKFYSILKHLNKNGVHDLKNIEMDSLFDYPKPVSLLKQLTLGCTFLPADKNEIILDFFAGSATTAHAVMQLNAEDGGNRKFIMVQLPEECEKKSEAYKAGYKTIAEISKERIRRAGAKILEGECHKDWNKDVGFRVLKVDTSNMADVYYSPDQVTQGSLDLLVDNIKTDRTDEDLLFQVLLDWGVDLTLPIRKETMQGKSVFFVDDDALVACFDLRINEALIKELAAKEPLRVVFRDDGFESDAVKINAEQIFKQVSPHTEVKAI
ncbi:MAG: site-specific DNA-methyltransferase [Shewanella sp.]|uniref:site-specific DNA-methyltransferase n=1 Tax=Plesiomonas shigelloides TaxID=703 RepID=UPI00351D4ACA